MCFIVLGLSHFVLFFSNFEFFFANFEFFVNFGQILKFSHHLKVSWVVCEILDVQQKDLPVLSPRRGSLA